MRLNRLPKFDLQSGKTKLGTFLSQHLLVRNDCAAALYIGRTRRQTFMTQSILVLFLHYVRYNNVFSSKQIWTHPLCFSYLRAKTKCLTRTVVQINTERILNEKDKNKLKHVDCSTITAKIRPCLATFQ